MRRRKKWECSFARPQKHRCVPLHFRMPSFVLPIVDVLSDSLKTQALFNTNFFYMFAYDTHEVSILNLCMHDLLYPLDNRRSAVARADSRWRFCVSPSRDLLIGTVQTYAAVDAQPLCDCACLCHRPTAVHPYVRAQMPSDAHFLIAAAAL